MGTVQRVLVEGASRKSSAGAPELMGRTDCNRVVNFAASPAALRLMGQMADVRITDSYGYSLGGEVCVRAEALATA